MTGMTLQLARNDVRALAPLGASAACAMVFGSLFEHKTVNALAELSYILGSLAIAAHAFGHEYAHRTLATLLTQPVDRRRIFLSKLAVAAVLLVALTGVAYATLFRGGQPPTFPDVSANTLVAIVVVGALSLAPLLTMICRGTLAGALFASAVPGLITTGTGFVGIIRFGIADDAAIEAFQWAVFWRVMPIVIAASAAASWWMFLRLEATEGRDRQIDLRSWLSRVRPASDAAPAAPRHPVWQLVLKELHLQQLSFAVAAFHCVTVGGVLIAVRLNPTLSMDIFLPLTLMYAAGQAMLIGSLASAEERHLGTFEWQMLMPVAAWRQWAIKTGVVMFVALILSVGLPAIFIQLLDGTRWGVDNLVPLMMILILTNASLYASSLTTDGVRALIVSVLLALGAWALLVWSGGIVVRLIDTFDGPFYVSRAAERAALIPAWVAAGLLIAVLIRFGYLNHRTVDAPLPRALRQLPWLAGIVVAGVALVTFVATRRW